MRKTIIACAVTALAVSGSTATAASLITSAKIADGTIMNRDIHAGTISENRLDGGVVAKLNRAGTPGTNGVNGVTGAKGDKGETGAAGALGQDGAIGAQGPQGQDGVSGYEVRTYDYIKGGARPNHDGVDASYGGAGNSSIATVACSSPDKVAVSGGYFIRNGTDESKNGTDAGGAFTSPALGQSAGVTASFPGRMDWAKNMPKPNRNDGWIVQFNGNGPTLDVTLYVVCVNAVS
jgi:Collagen triple helix repeat (20 copies)